MQGLACKMFHMKEVHIMPSKAQVPIQTPGGFGVQYTNTAQEQLASLSGELRNRLHDHLNMAASVNPQLHGKPVPGCTTTDRRVLEFENVTVTFWLSTPVKIMTVVDIRTGGDRDETMIPTPTPAAGTPLPFTSGFVGFGDEEDDEEAIVMASPITG